MFSVEFNGLNYVFLPWWCCSENLETTTDASESIVLQGLWLNVSYKPFHAIQVFFFVCFLHRNPLTTLSNAFGCFNLQTSAERFMLTKAVRLTELEWKGFNKFSHSLISGVCSAAKRVVWQRHRFEFICLFFVQLSFNFIRVLRPLETAGPHLYDEQLFELFIRRLCLCLNSKCFGWCCRGAVPTRHWCFVWDAVGGSLAIFPDCSLFSFAHLSLCVFSCFSLVNTL